MTKVAGSPLDALPEAARGETAPKGPVSTHWLVAVSRGVRWRILRPFAPAFMPEAYASTWQASDGTSWHSTSSRPDSDAV